MKNTLILIIAWAANFCLSAQPTTITWQGKLLDADGNAITQNNVAMTFAMFDASTGGNQLWPASGVVAKVVNVLNGLYSLQLGTGVGDDIAFTAAMFDGFTPWLEVKVGTETLPRTEITNVPFALISNQLSATGWENPGELGKIIPNTGKFTSLETGSVKITDGASDGKVLTSDAEGNTSWQTPSYQSSGTAPGQMQYWNGSAWVTVAVGQNGQTLFYKNGLPIWEYPDKIINHFSIGDYYQGGIIAYFLQPGDPGYDANVRHGLIVAPSNQSTAAQWGCVGTYIGGTGTSIGTGAANTAAIVAGCGTAGIAARIAYDLELNDYSDWYLPSKDELYKIYLNKNLIGSFSPSYWSSSEHSSNIAYIQNFNSGYQGAYDKISTPHVRAVRAF